MTVAVRRECRSALCHHATRAFEQIINTHDLVQGVLARVQPSRRRSPSMRLDLSQRTPRSRVCNPCSGCSRPSREAVAASSRHPGTHAAHHAATVSSRTAKSSSRRAHSPQLRSCSRSRGGRPPRVEADDDLVQASEDLVQPVTNDRLIEKSLTGSTQYAASGSIKATDPGPIMALFTVLTGVTAGVLRVRRYVRQQNLGEVPARLRRHLRHLRPAHHQADQHAHLTLCISAATRPMQSANIGLLFKSTEDCQNDRLCPAPVLALSNARVEQSCPDLLPEGSLDTLLLCC